MMRFFPAVLTSLGLMACSPPVPDSGAGVGFGDYQQYQGERSARDTQLQRPIAQNTPAGTTTVAPVVATPTARAAPAAAPVPAPVRNTGISDEQDFDAVAGRETIQSDAQRIAQNRAQYQQVAPTAAPTRTGASSEPNIVRYALQTNNVVGQKLYRRFGVFTQAKYASNCAKYFSPDRAQEDFLRAGGPGRDKFGLDPDGDGFACGWNPATFRRAAQGG